MIQFNMATGELISSAAATLDAEEQAAYETHRQRLQPELHLQTHKFEPSIEKGMPVDLAMVGATLFIAAQLL